MNSVGGGDSFRKYNLNKINQMTCRPIARRDSAHDVVVVGRLPCAPTGKFMTTKI